MPAQQHYHYNVLRKIIIQFLDLFNDISIARYNQDTGAVIKYVKIPLRFAPKTKQFWWKELQEAGDRRDQVLPMMAVDLENVEYAQDRQTNRNHKISIVNDSGTTQQYFNPVPYDFTFKLQIVSEYMVDITQIVEQIFPFFTPETYIRITIPELNITGLGESDETGTDKLELRVVYESATKESPIELDEAGYRILRWDLTFKVQGYLFSPVCETSRIHKVIQNYYTSDETWEDREADIELREGELGGQVMQGTTYATNIPDDGVQIDDTIRALYSYEHFEHPSNYVYDSIEDDEVWIEDDDGLPINDTVDRNVRE
ncbi:MAG: hypothetical protein KQ78_02142 [Candidatus Izimaplasma bacterium HR2]|nr:MAG: hypothetical protein KQ78_02142 [Candidatus Izimaplasma bacterium HR2]